MYVASKLPTNNGSCGWIEMLPRRPPKPALEGAVTADIAIIGAGFAGLSAARRLSLLDPTLRVVVLEAELVGEGTSGRNSGFIIDLLHEVSADDLGGGSIERARRDLKLYRTAIDLGRVLAEENGWGKDVFDPCDRFSVARGPQGDEHILGYAQALDLLKRLGALGMGGALSCHGQAMAQRPAHPRVAHLLLRGQSLGLGSLACEVAALMGERDLLRGAGADLHERVALLAGGTIGLCLSRPRGPPTS